MKIGIDLDNILAEIISPLTEFHNKTYNTSYSFPDYKQYELDITWNCTEKESIERVFAFYKSPFFSRIKPVTGSREVIDYLSQKYDLCIITSRPHIVEKETTRWINKYFPKKFKGIYHTNQFSKLGSVRKQKSEVCKAIGASILIEDCLEFALESASHGITTYLIDKPWNQSKTLPQNVTRVFGWEDLEKKI